MIKKANIKALSDLLWNNQDMDINPVIMYENFMKNEQKKTIICGGKSRHECSSARRRERCDEEVKVPEQNSVLLYFFRFIFCALFFAIHVIIHFQMVSCMWGGIQLREQNKDRLKDTTERDNGQHDAGVTGGTHNPKPKCCRANGSMVGIS